MSEHTFENRAWVERLPIHLAERITKLNSDISLNGEHTTANEIVAVIEMTLGHLGRLWVAEYIHAAAIDAAINRDLLDLSGRPVLTGQWVSLARRIRQLFAKQSLPTVVAGLEELDFGAQDDAVHPVTRLIAYRNSFSHGSLSSVVEDIRAYRHLIEQLIAGIPALWEQPIHCFIEEDGPPRLAVQGWPLAKKMMEREEGQYQPFVIGTDGQTRMRLYPLLYAVSTEKGISLRAGKSKGRQHALETLFEQETLRLWYGRYQREQQGHLAFEEVLQARTYPNLSSAVISEVREALSAPQLARVIVEAHPGSGKAGLVAHLEKISPPAYRVETASYMIEPGGLSQSGVTFARFLLRRTETALRLDEGTYSSEDSQLPAAVAKAEERLLAEGVMLLVGIEDLHHGISAYQKERLSIMDVFALPEGGGIRLLGTVYPGRVNRHLPCDRRIVLPAPDRSALALDELRMVMMDLCPSDDTLGRRTLLTLMQAGQPLTLFSLCDALEVDGHSVFEPVVEQTLWRLLPLLLVDGAGAERKWQPLGGLSRSWFSNGG